MYNDRVDNKNVVEGCVALLFAEARIGEAAQQADAKKAAEELKSIEDCKEALWERAKEEESSDSRRRLVGKETGDGNGKKSFDMFGMNGSIA